MKTIKCPECGLQNWATAEWCQRCKAQLKSATVSNVADAANNTQTNFNNQNGNQNYRSSAAQFNGGAANNANGFFAKSLRSCHRNLLIACVLSVAAVIASLTANSRYLFNAVAGPSAVAQDELLDARSAADAPHNYVKFTAADVYDTGVKYVETSRKYGTETTKYKYVALEIGDKLLLAKVDSDSPLADGANDVAVVGELNDLTSQENEEIIRPLAAKQPELRDAILPYLIDARSGYSTWAFIWIGVGTILTILAGGVFVNVFRRYGDIEKSAALKPLAARGNPQTLAAEIDRDIEQNYQKIGSNHLSPNWIVRKTLFSISVQPIEDIVWVYRKTTRHSVNFIPTGKTHEVVLHNNLRGTMSLAGRSMRDNDADYLIETIYKRAPWIVTGYDADLSKHWSSDANGFINSVAERKKAFHQN